MGGQLVLRSSLFPVALQSVRSSGSVDLRFYNEPKGSGTAGSVKPDVPLGSPGMDIDEGEMLLFLPILGKSDRRWRDGLLLRCVEDRDNSLPSCSGGSHVDFHCRRLGLGTLYYQDAKQVFDDKVVLII